MANDMIESDETDVPEYVEITDVLDLHGFYPEQIPEVIEEFLRGAVEKNLCHLRIIHGKGKSRLKYEVHQALQSNPYVVWFGDAPQEYGGWGATIVELSEQSTIQETKDE